MDFSSCFFLSFFFNLAKFKGGNRKSHPLDSSIASRWRFVGSSIWPDGQSYTSQGPNHNLKAQITDSRPLQQGLNFSPEPKFHDRPRGPIIGPKLCCYVSNLSVCFLVRLNPSIGSDMRDSAQSIYRPVTVCEPSNLRDFDYLSGNGWKIHLKRAF